VEQRPVLGDQGLQVDQVEVSLLGQAAAFFLVSLGTLLANVCWDAIDPPVIAGRLDDTEDKIDEIDLGPMTQLLPRDPAIAAFQKLQEVCGKLRVDINSVNSSTVVSTVRIVKHSACDVEYGTTVCPVPNCHAGKFTTVPVDSEIGVPVDR